MNQIKARFRINKVGQGCFYSGLIIDEHTNKSFSVVYDCGTKSNHLYIKNEIDNFRSKLNNQLDLLIISHFDEDHVNEVLTLLEGLIKCQR